MKKMTILILVLIAAALGPGCTRKTARMPAPESGSGTLIIELEGFRNNRGEVILSLFRSEKGFPDDMDRAVRNVQAPIADYRAEAVLENLPYGVYAFSVLHDENCNGKMDSTLIGIPKEGHGASNDAQRQFAPPEFEDAKFVLNSGELKMREKIHYFKRKKPWGGSGEKSS